MTQTFIPPKGGWVLSQARNLPETWASIEKSRSPGLPVRTSTILVIFFEETACSNIVQLKHPYAIGPGQLQLSDYPQRHFVAGQTAGGRREDNGLGGVWDSHQMLKSTDKSPPRPVRPDLKPLTREMVLADFDFSVALSTKMFEWEWKGFGVSGKRYQTEDALVSVTQLGGQSSSVRTTALLAFRHAANQLEALMNEKIELPFQPDGSLPPSFYDKRRRRFADILNRPRILVKQPSAIPYDTFKGFWAWFLPDGFVENPRGYMRWGY